jgi:hypothetical protein
MNEKIFERVKKLLELSASANEHEAALAYKRAQEIIAKYSLDMSRELKVETIVEKFYELKIKETMGLKEKLPFILDIVARPFGVHTLISARYEDGQKIPAIKLVGFETNVDIAAYTVDCILNQCLIDYRQGYSRERSIIFGHNFWTGVVHALSERFKQPEEQAPGLVVYDKVREYMEKYPMATVEGTNVIGHSGVSEGIQSGKNAQIRPGVRANNGGKLLK